MRRLGVAILTLVLVATAAQAQTYNVLYDFGSHQGDPTAPYGIITQGRDGNLYGNSDGSATSGLGDFFKITPSGTLTVLASTFESSSGLSLGTDGRFYGTFVQEGPSRLGKVFSLTAAGQLHTLHDFTGADGAAPYAAPIQGIDGNWYGTTAYGGSSCYLGCGTVYELAPSGILRVLHSFSLQGGGSEPISSLLQATNGNFYGATLHGGEPGSYGTIFEISPSGKFMLTFDFDYARGANPRAAMIEGSDGRLYGVTPNGGAYGTGVVFRLAAGVYDVLHDFALGSNSAYPWGGLVQATDGNLYGTTSYDNTSPGSTCGSIFRVTPLGMFDTIYTFPNDGSLGCDPESALIQDTNGLLYGTTPSGGSVDAGVFFSLDLGLAPFVTFLPAARQVGHTVEILGQGFTGTTAVSFNGTPATTFDALTDTFLTATVPNGATTGFITVTTPSGTLASNKHFQVKPQITGFSPTSGPVGTSVVITGVSLSQTSKVTFGSAVATSFTVNSDTQVTVTVPAGATTTKIGLTTTGAPVYGATAFTVTQ